MTISIEKTFAAAEEAVSWANDGIRELDSLITDFFALNPAELITEVDPDTGENVRKVKFTPDIPKNFRRKTTEALLNARHSFDQSIFAAHSILTAGTPKKTYYPWAQSPTDLEGLFNSRKIDESIRDTIRSHEPYPTSDIYAGGNDLIRTLATIANKKHTVGLTINADIAIVQSVTHFQGTNIGSFTSPTPRWDSVKREADLIRWRGDGKIDDNYDIALKICLDEPRLSTPMDIVTMLKAFTEQAQIVCESLKAKCIEHTL